MPLQIVQPSKAHVAGLTAIGFLLAMSQQVTFKVVSASEFSVAIRALVSFDRASFMLSLLHLLLRWLLRVALSKMLLTKDIQYQHPG